MDLAEPIAARGGKILVRANVLQINEERGNVTGVTVLPTGAKSGGKPFFIPGQEDKHFNNSPLKFFALETDKRTFMFVKTHMKTHVNPAYFIIRKMQKARERGTEAIYPRKLKFNKWFSNISECILNTVIFSRKEGLFLKEINPK